MFEEATNVRPLPFVEEHEEQKARELIDADFLKMTGKTLNFRPAGYMILCKIWVRPEEYKKVKREDGTEATIWIPPSASQEDKYQSVSALVCGIGPLAFRDRETGKMWHGGPVCRIGDWIAIPRYESALLSYRGVAMALLPDDRIYGVIEDPADLRPAHLADKF